MNPWIIVGFLVALITTGIGGCHYGKRIGTQACAAKAGAQMVTTKAVQDNRDAAVEVIAAETQQATAAATHQTKANTHESIERIRTVVVPGPCRDVDPVIVREHAEAQQRINAKIRSGVRPSATGATGSDAGH